MRVCEICNAKKEDRIIAGMSICNNCFTRLQGLRNGNEDDLLFFRDPINVSKFSHNAKNILMKLQQILKSRIGQLKK